MKKIYGLQQLRAIAALFVVLYHMTYIAQENLNYVFWGGIFRFGYSGVDIFFVLSGFVVYYIHHKEIGKTSFGFPYIIKKCLRILPPYWVVLSALLVVYLLVPSYGLAQTRNPVYIIESFLLLPLRNMTYSALSVAWSLRYELLFYLLFGVAIFLKRKPARLILSLWVAISLVNFILSQVGLGTDNFDFNFLFSAYNLEFAFGCFAAHLVLNRSVSRTLSLTVFTVGTVVFITNAIMDVSKLLQMNRFLFYGIPVVLIIYGIASYEIDHRLKCFQPLVYLGNASYSVFLVHLPVISILDKIFTKIGIYGRIGYFAGTVIIFVLAVSSGCLFYELIEKRLNRILSGVRTRQVKQSGSITQ